MINHASVVVEDSLLVTGLARQFKVLCDHVNGVDVDRPEEIKVPRHHIVLVLLLLHSTYHGDKQVSLYSLLGFRVPSPWTSDEGFLLLQHSRASHFGR